MERISADYIRGYTRAIQDTIEVFESVKQGLNVNKKHFNDKMALELLHCILENRDKLRENCEGFIRWNVTTKKFEYFNPTTKPLQEPGHSDVYLLRHGYTGDVITFAGKRYVFTEQRVGNSCVYKLDE